MRTVAIVLLGVLTACTGAGDGTDAGPAVLEFDADGVFEEATERYRVELRIPFSQNAAVVSDIKAYLQASYDEFVASTADEPEAGYFDEHQYELVADWETAESDYIYTFIVRGHAYTGGAHGLPFVRTFSYSKSDNTRIELAMLLANEESLDRIAERASVHFGKDSPHASFAAGLEPDWSNWQNWFSSNNRITFLFPVYQVAAYAEGEQSFSVFVDVRTSHLFNLDFFDLVPSESRVTDEHGHGPDPGSGEAARSIAWQFIRGSGAYAEDGHDLEITNVERHPDVDGGWFVDCTWKHSGDPDVLYTGRVLVRDDRPEMVESSITSEAQGD